MRTQDRAHLTLALRELLEAVGVLFEDTATCDQAPELLAPAKRVQAAADEVFDRVRLLAVPATLVFAGGAVQLGDLVEVDDKGAQSAMAAEHNSRADKIEAERGWTEQRRWDHERLEAARGEAGLTALLDDTAPAHSSDRDHRQSA